MSFFDRLFGADTASVLAKAEKALERGDAARAIELARRASASSREPSQRTAADDLVERARRARFEDLLAKADRTESAGHLDDAVTWLEAALELADSEVANHLRRRVDRLQAKRAASARTEAAARFAGPNGASERYPEDAETLEIDPDLLFDTLASMICEELAPAYQDRPLAFRRAFVDLNEGRAALAHAPLLELHRLAPDDEIVHFELGRVRLALHDYGAAREDFEAVWDAFGDGPIDTSGSLSVPLLWADAVAGLGELEAVVDRLAAVASSSEASAEVAERYAEALVATDRFEAARDYLAVARNRYPNHPVFPYLYAAIQARLGERETAVGELERLLAPSCRSGRCDSPRAHRPALRLLIELLLDRQDLDRLGDLMALQAGLLEGRLEAADWALRARYCEAVGDVDAAEEARLQMTRPG